MIPPDFLDFCAASSNQCRHFYGTQFIAYPSPDRRTLSFCNESASRHGRAESTATLQPRLSVIAVRLLSLHSRRDFADRYVAIVYGQGFASLHLFEIAREIVTKFANRGSLYSCILAKFREQRFL